MDSQYTLALQPNESLLNKRYKLHQLHDALRNNKENYLEFYGRNNIYFRKSYAEVYDDVKKVISLFRNMDLSPGDRIGIMGSNSYEYLLADLAAIMGGYVSVPFPDKYFSDRIGSLETEFNLRFFLVDSSYLEQQPEYYTARPLEQLLELAEEFSADEECVHIPNDEDKFMVIFTSGTTSIPKGIEVRSKCIEEWISVLSDRFSFNSDDKVLDFLPLSISNARLLVYAAILLPFNLTVTLPERLMWVLQASKPTILQGVPYLFETVYRNIMKSIEASPLNRAAYNIYHIIRKILPPRVKTSIQTRIFGQAIQFWGGRMRILVTGSAPINKKVVSLFNDMGLTIYESYGINEVGLVSINSPESFRLGSVGKPFPTKEIVIGKNQEILIRSEYSWGQSYINETEEKNEEVFRSDGFISTGDMGYIDKDGYLYVIGRIKELIVLTTGEKVHPNYLEQRLKSSNSINQAVVFGDGKPFISCVLVLNEDGYSESEINKIISDINEDLPNEHRIHGYILANEPFTIENGLLNSTLKINKEKVYETYKNEIESLYKEN